jgi:hypothetical protein
VCGLVLPAHRRAVATTGYPHNARLRGLVQAAQAAFVSVARAFTRRVACENRLLHNHAAGLPTRTASPLA